MGSTTCEGWKRFSAETLQRMEQAESDGFEIIIGNNPYLDKAAKWANHEVRKIAQTNSRRHGRPVRTVWAVRPKAAAGAQGLVSSENSHRHQSPHSHNEQ
jgi:hypothetical protein